MLRKHLWIALSMLTAMLLTIQPASAADLVGQIPGGATFRVGDGTLRVQFWSDEVVRVTYANGTELPTLTSLSVIAAKAETKTSFEDGDGAWRLAGPAISVKIDKQTGAVAFFDKDGKALLSEVGGSREMKPATQQNVSGEQTALAFNLAAGEGIYGLGQHQDGTWNYRTAVARPRGRGRRGGGEGAPVPAGVPSIRLAQGNTNVCIPVVTSSKGYILLWDDPAVTTIGMENEGNSAANAGKMSWASEWGKAIDYYFCYGDGTAETALKAYRGLTGEVPMMPIWMLGFWQCKERYASQEELLGVAERYREMKVPVDGIIQDWQYWPDGNGNWGSHKFDPTRYPDPVGMFKKLHDENYHTLISVWAKFDTGSDNSKELNEKGGMFPQIVRYVFPPGQGQWYNPFAKAGREIYWRQMRDQLFAKGVDGWWLDAPEPEIDANTWRTYQTGNGPAYEYFNAYPLVHSQGIYQGQRAATDQKRVVILTRSAYAGQQRNSAITWSGDIQGTWESLAAQVPAGLNFSLSGIPYWNTDTGGFFGNRSAGNGDATDPAYQQLFARWFQFSAFCPMFRVHGSYGLKPGKEIWRFDEKTQEIMRKYLDLRYRLLPYLYSVAWQVSANGDTFMRPLVMDYASDPKVTDIGNQYSFGPAMMVTPVTTRDATTQAVYLPATKAPWFNFWTGATSKGGEQVTAEAPIETMPIYVPGGTILPMGPYLQYSKEKPADPIELRIYPGADGHFTLYEDQGDTYNYEKGAYATTELSWDDASKTLSIGARKGEFPGMLKSHTFNVVIVKDGHGAGIAPVESPDKVVSYDGAATKVQIGD